MHGFPHPTTASRTANSTSARTESRLARAPSRNTRCTQTVPPIVHLPHPAHASPPRVSTDSPSPRPRSPHREISRLHPHSTPSPPTISSRSLSPPSISSSRSPSPLAPPRRPLVAPTPRPHRSLPWTRSASTARSLASLPRRRASHRSVIARLDSSASPTPLAPSPRPALASSSVRPFPSRALSLDSPRAHARTPRSHARARAPPPPPRATLHPSTHITSRSGPGGGTVLESPSVGGAIASRASRAPRAPAPIDRSSRSGHRLDGSPISIGLDRSSRSVDRSVVSIGSVSIGRLDRAVGRSRDAREDAGLDARWRRARARWWWDRRDVGGCDR